MQKKIYSLKRHQIFAKDQFKTENVNVIEIEMNFLMYADYLQDQNKMTMLFAPKIFFFIFIIYSLAMNYNF